MKQEEVFNKLEKEFNENINSHVFLIETDDVERCHKEIKKLIANFIALDDEQSLHQIDEEKYLELVIVRPDGTSIKKDQILELQDRIKTKPVLSNYIFYIILSADKLNDVAANKLLKTIEEPNENVIGFMITSSLESMLPTVKSRSEILNIKFEERNIEEIPQELFEAIDALIESIEKKDHHLFYKTKMNDNIFKDNYRIVANKIKEYYNTACGLQMGINLNKKTVTLLQNKNEPDKLLKKAEILNRLLNKLASNMNGDLLLEKIYLNLKEV